MDNPYAITTDTEQCLTDASTPSAPKIQWPVNYIPNPYLVTKPDPSEDEIMELDEGLTYMEDTSVCHSKIDTFKEIAHLVKHMKSEISLSLPELLVGIGNLAKKMPKISPSGECIYDLEDIQRSYRFMKFASVAYGSLYTSSQDGVDHVASDLTRLANQNPKEFHRRQIQAVLNHTGIAKEDILATEWKQRRFRPAHYLAIDHETKSILLVLRGSYSGQDILTDLVASSAKFKEGYAHKGMLSAAKWFGDNFTDLLKELRGIHPLYRVRVVGHSLGAGVAAILGLILKDEIDDIECYAYACPMVLSEEMAAKCYDFCTSFVFGTDIVPRLSYVTVRDLQVSMVKDPDKKYADKSPQMASDLQRTQSVIISSLYPPGKIMQIAKIPRLQRKVPERKYEMYETSRASVNEIIIHRHMLADHLMSRYERGLLQILNREQKTPG